MMWRTGQRPAGTGSRWQVENEGRMYAGNLIEDLMETVERAEQRALQARSQEEKLAAFYAVSRFEIVQSESIFAGVA